jgi:sugar phosphate isomerase/epimerase
MTITIGAVSLGWHGTELPQVCKQLAAMGGVCIEINGNAEHHHGVAINSETGPLIQSWASDAGLQIRSLSGYCDFAQVKASALDAEIERLLVTCRAASEMGVGIVRAFVGDVKPDVTLEMVRSNIVGAFREACDQAADLGVVLAIENHGRLINAGPALAELVDEVGVNNLGFTLDTGNFAWAGHSAEAVARDFAAVIPRTVNVHVKDGVWTNAGFTFVPAGEGQLPIAWLVDSLRAHGYGGPIYSEYEGAGDFLQGTKRSIAYLKELLEST